ncbi:conserved hypothetical protein [Gammaproteobacteria bacterium]
MKSPFIAYSQFFSIGFRLIVVMLTLPSAIAGETSCTPPTTTPVSAEQVYWGLPYAPGDRSEYAVSYMGLLAGHARLEVHPPILRDGLWQQVYEADARTGQWYRMVFVGHDSILAYSHPPAGTASHYVLEQDEGRLMGKRTHRRTEIHFDPGKCTVTESIEEPGKAPQIEQVEVSAGVLDTLSATFHLRALDYQPGASVRLPVYSSHKSWWLEAEALTQELVEVPAGVFATIKLRLHTYLGDALQQKGDMTVWIALDRPEHPLVQVKAEVRIGSLLLELVRFRPGLAP